MLKMHSIVIGSLHQYNCTDVIYTMTFHHRQ